MDRREFLAGAVPALALLAGCTGDGGDGSTPTATPTGTPTGTPTDASTLTPTEADTATGTPTDTATATEATDPDQTVTVVSFDFQPQSFTVAAGDTVKWVWEGDLHNVIADETPEGSSWEGTPDGPGRTYSSGYTYSHTFETTGSYTYYCVPHQSQGMTGSFTVE